MTLAATITNSSITAYMSRVDVELAHDGQAEQQSEHAALPQQHASYKIKFNNIVKKIVSDYLGTFACTRKNGCPGANGCLENGITIGYHTQCNTRNEKVQ